MSKFDSWIENKTFQNLFIWFCLFLILSATIQADNKIATALFAILFLAPPIYLNNLVILPYFFKYKLTFWLLFVLNAIAFTFIAVFFIGKTMKDSLSLDMLLNFLGILILALTFASALKISRDSFLRRQEVKNAELQLLRAQLNPHFLFNTLNNLYGLSVVKSDKLPNLMLKLSDLLRYSLYDTKATHVALERELEYIENYISLEKIRLEDKVDIELRKEGLLYNKNIAPMLLIVFIENAFKHLSYKQTQMNFVNISIEGKENTLSFRCENSLDHKSEEKALEHGKSGIGLENAKKRLSLLYPEQHNLSITQNRTTFTIVLKLEL